MAREQLAYHSPSTAYGGTAHHMSQQKANLIRLSDYCSTIFYQGKHNVSCLHLLTCELCGLLKSNRLLQWPISVRLQVAGFVFWIIDQLVINRGRWAAYS